MNESGYMSCIAKRIFKTVLLGAGLILLVLQVGCGGDNADSTASLEPVNVLTIIGDDRMRFSPQKFAVKAGDTIQLTLENVGTMPKETMGHNLVILKPDTNLNAFSAAAVRYPKNHYIPEALVNQVVASTIVIGPKETTQIEFVAPTEPGEYPFICSFPAHTTAGMRGVMIVK